MKKTKKSYLQMTLGKELKVKKNNNKRYFLKKYYEVGIVLSSIALLNRKKKEITVENVIKEIAKIKKFN